MDLSRRPRRGTIHLFATRRATNRRLNTNTKVRALTAEHSEHVVRNQQAIASLFAKPFSHRIDFPSHNSSLRHVSDEQLANGDESL